MRAPRWASGTLSRCGRRPSDRRDRAARRSRRDDSRTRRRDVRPWRVDRRPRCALARSNDMIRVDLPVDVDLPVEMRRMNMAGRGAALADQFEKALGELTQTVESMPDDKWQATCGEGWTVAATAQHVAAQFPLEKTYISAAAEGTAPPQHSMDDINKTNESRAKDVSSVSKADVLRQLREGG